MHKSLRLLAVAMILTLALAPNLVAGQKAKVSVKPDTATRFKCTIDCGDGENGGTLTTPDANSCLRACEAACQVDECEFV
jgi:hypothetical protein